MTIRFDDLLQSHVLSIANAVSPSDEQLHCIDLATSYHDVELPAPFQVRFDAIRHARWSAFAITEARSWLTQRGLLDKIPTFVPGKTDETAFTRQVEEICGPTARGAFQSSYGPRVISPEWVISLGMPPKAKNQEAIRCLLNVTSVAGFNAVGFIGNEAYANEK